MKTVGNDYLLDFYYNDLFVKVSQTGVVVEISLDNENLKGGYIILKDSDVDPSVLSSIKFEASILLEEYLKGE